MGLNKKLTKEQMQEVTVYYKLSNDFTSEVKEKYFANILDQEHIDNTINMQELGERFGISKATCSRIVSNYKSFEESKPTRIDVLNKKRSKAYELWKKKNNKITGEELGKAVGVTSRAANNWKKSFREMEKVDGDS